MSAAILAGSAKERAQIAAGFIRRGQLSGRALFDCFEMGDGDEVKARLVALAQRSPSFDAHLRRHLPHWFVAVSPAQ